MRKFFLDKFLLLFFLSVLACLQIKVAQANCATLPQPSANETSVIVDSVNGLKNEIASADGSAKTIFLRDGVYSLPYTAINKPNLTIRSLSGNRENVILDGEYRSGQNVFHILAKNVTIADLTIKRAFYHPIHVGGGGDNVKLYNLHIIDGKEQQVKVNPSSGNGNDYGELACSLIELTQAGRDKIKNTPTPGFTCYTGGIDTHQATGWIVRDNIFKNIYCDNGLAEHAIHFWNNTSDTTIERNQIINCARGIGFGLGSKGNSGGVIRNNMISFDSALNGVFDVGIGLENSSNSKVYNNTIFSSRSYANAIEYRFANTTSTISNNLTNKLIQKRNGGDATLQNNITNAQSNWFSDSVNGDLHLSSSVSDVVDKGVSLSGFSDDFDGESRVIFDVGADEWNGINPITTTTSSTPTTTSTTTSISATVTNNSTPTTATTSNNTTSSTSNTNNSTSNTSSNTSTNQSSSGGGGANRALASILKASQARLDARSDRDNDSVRRNLWKPQKNHHAIYRKYLSEMKQRLKKVKRPWIEIRKHQRLVSMLW